jgi:hypothetical protein
MISWLRRVLGFPVHKPRANPRVVPQLHPLPSTQAELVRTEPEHRDRLKKVDRILNDYQRMDGALRLEPVRKR